MDALCRVSPLTQRDRLRLYACCFLVLVFDGIDVAVVPFLAPWMKSDSGFDNSLLTQVFLATTVGFALGGICIGHLADRYGRRPALIGSVAIFAVGSLLSPLSSAPDQFAALRLLVGVGLGGALPVCIAWCTSAYSGCNRILLTTLTYCGFTLGMALGAALAKPLLGLMTWAQVIAVLGGAPLLAIPLMMAWLPKHSPIMQGFENACVTPTLQRQTYTLRLWLAFCLSLMTFYLISYWLPVINTGLGLSPSLVILLPVGGTLGAVVFALLMQYYAAHNVLFAGYLAGALVTASAWLILPHGVHLPWFIFLTGFFIAGCQNGLNIHAALAYPEHARTRFTGIVMSGGRVGAIAGVGVGGLMLDSALPVELWISVLSGGLLIVGICLKTVVVGQEIEGGA
ncbi:MFS transporter [Pseudomonas sp. NPDC089752]|uniref:MFS transporter n=1 Tax=Pseudomonas sp. NPDC089752 TaxID=3364472 RepID=UPI0037FAB9F4